jgi:hypothetical protein
MIDFRELPEDGTALEQLMREIFLIWDMRPQWTGKGPDQGRDILMTEKAMGVIDNFSRTWLVQCKHFAHSGRSVGRKDVGSVIDDCRQVGATGYLLVCSTQPSSSLINKLNEMGNNKQNHLKTKIWDAVDIEKCLYDPRCLPIGHLFFPKSILSMTWRIFNSGAPDKWTAQYKGYFLFLSCRVAGTYPPLRECENLISLPEGVKPLDGHESIRPRSIFLDDKHGVFHVSADYLVPDHQEPSLSPRDVNKALRLNDNVDICSDDASLYTSHWYIRVKQIQPQSDHFDMDKQAFYSDIASFEDGFSGPTIEDLAIGNFWY